MVQLGLINGADDRGVSATPTRHDGQSPNGHGASDTPAGVPSIWVTRR